ncbi:MAG TPA: response regulator [Rhodocyclaceae bacterium]|nr:response regulator [Rhodocyclaceae bacterium]
MKILIVDDSAAIQAIVRRALQKEGFANDEFRTAGNGQAALEIIESWIPDLVITDWHMPGMSGLELLQVLQQTRQQRMRVGFVTTESAPERLNEAMRNGAAFILPKPFTDRQLADAVRQALGPGCTREAEARTAGQEEPADFRVNEAEAIENHLCQTLKARVHLDEVRDFDLESMMPPWYLAFYGVGNEGDVRGFCVLDRGAVALIGGRLAGLTPAELRAGAQFPPAVGTQIGAMLKFSGHQLFVSPDNVVPLVRSQLLYQIAPKVREILGKGQGRKTYRISAAGHALGLIALLAH